MSFKITQIELTFENLESVTISGEYIEDIGMVELTDIVDIKANEVDVIDNVECMFLKISEGANGEYVDKISNKKGTVFERVMKYRDISIVRLFLLNTDIGNNTERSYYVPWEGQCDENLRQRTVYEGGGLTIYID